MLDKPKLTSKLLPYSLAIFVIAIAVSMMKNGVQFWEGWRREYILPAIIFIPLFAATTWLRWDWAPYAAAKRRQERNRKPD